MGQDAYSEGFLEHIANKIQQHIDELEPTMWRTFMRTFGAYPYSVSHSLNHYEGYIKDRFKLIFSSKRTTRTITFLVRLKTTSLPRQTQPPNRMNLQQIYAGTSNVTSMPPLWLATAKM